LGIGGADWPQTGGEAERLVRTLISEWAYASPFTEPGLRIAAPGRFLDFYNYRRPHPSLAGQPPISRTPVNNLTGKIS
jgi:transposase InsO family protein